MNHPRFAYKDQLERKNSQNSVYSFQPDCEKSGKNSDASTVVEPASMAKKVEMQEFHSQISFIHNSLPKNDDDNKRKSIPDLKKCHQEIYLSPTSFSKKMVEEN